MYLCPGVTVEGVRSNIFVQLYSTGPRWMDHDNSCSFKCIPDQRSSAKSCRIEKRRKRSNEKKDKGRRQRKDAVSGEVRSHRGQGVTSRSTGNRGSSAIISPLFRYVAPTVQSAGSWTRCHDPSKSIITGYHSPTLFFIVIVVGHCRSAEVENDAQSAKY